MSRRVKGEGSVYQRKSDGRWVYAVDLGQHGTKKRERRYATARTLRELRPKIKALNDRLGARLHGDGSMSLEKWLNEWLDNIAPETTKPSTRTTYRGYLDNWIIPHLGSKRLDSLRPADIRALYKEMEKAGRATATRVQVHAILKRALHVAEQDRVIDRSPMQSVGTPGGDKGSHGKLTTEEARKVMRVLANRPDRSRWYAALLLGLRQGEALGLAWEDVDFANDEIHIRQSLGRVNGEFVLGPVKSQASRRVVPLPLELKVALRDVPRTGPLVWGPMHNRTDYDHWQALLKEAGVPPRALHAARASTASILYDLGTPSKHIAEILGHAQTMTTEGHYIHGDKVIHTKAIDGMARELTAG